jgi:competence protein ComEA
MTRNTAGERLGGWPGAEAVDAQDADVATPIRGVPLVAAPQPPDEQRRTSAARARFTAAAATVPSDAPVPGARRARHRLRWQIAPRTAAIALLALALIAGTAVFRSLSAVSGTPVELAEPRATATPASPVEQPSAVSTVLVHVVGQVAAPGLVELPTGARVSDAVDAAGGPLPDADLAAVNLAAPVQDGAQVRVPAPGEIAADVTGSTADGGLIDLNRASATQLEELPGVGPVLAARIVEDREANGPFTSVDDLDRVSGIGPSVLANLRDRATV